MSNDIHYHIHINDSDKSISKRSEGSLQHIHIHISPSDLIAKRGYKRQSSAPPAPAEKKMKTKQHPKYTVLALLAQCLISSDSIEYPPGKDFRKQVNDTLKYHVLKSKNKYDSMTLRVSVMVPLLTLVVWEKEKVQTEYVYDMVVNILYRNIKSLASGGRNLTRKEYQDLCMRIVKFNVDNNFRCDEIDPAKPLLTIKDKEEEDLPPTASPPKDKDGDSDYIDESDDSLDSAIGGGKD